jgi:CyaY protein
MSPPIDEQQYSERATTALHALVDALDEVSQRTDAFEVELANDILTLEFPDGVRFVINSHRAARQIWMAANTSAWHFNWHAEAQKWLCSKTNAELWQVVAEQLHIKTGKPVSLPR